MGEIRWAALLPSVSTPFGERGGVDLAVFRQHVLWLVGHGANDLVVAGAAGEGNSLSFEERLDLLHVATEATRGIARVVATVCDTSTRRAVRLANEAEAAGCAGLIATAPLGYAGSWRETRTHLAAILGATSLPAAVENRPGEPGIELGPDRIAELATVHPALEAVVEASAVPGRVEELRRALDGRLEILIGLDGVAIGGLRSGATGWVSAIANVLPRESAALFALERTGDPRAAEVRRWLDPLLRIGARPDAIQALKHLQQEIGHGSGRVRPPRLPLDAAEGEGLAREMRAVLAGSPLGAEIDR